MPRLHPFSHAGRPGASRLGAVLALAASLAASACAERQVPAGRQEPREEHPAESGRPPRAAPEWESAAVATRGYLIYSVRWGRAEDLALTLEPVLQSRYGPSARVVPHVPSNKLFIYLPPPGEREALPSARGVPAAPRSAARGGPNP